MNISYNPRFEKQDKKYLESLALQTTELPEIKIKNDRYEIFDKETSSKITIRMLGENKFTLNGKTFEYDTSIPLETNLEQIRSLLENEKVSFWDQVFLPYSYAGNKNSFPIFAIGAVTLFLGAVIYDYNRAQKSEDRPAPKSKTSNSHKSAGGLSTWEIGPWKGADN